MSLVQAGVPGGPPGGGGGPGAMIWLHIGSSHVKAAGAEQVTIEGPGPGALGVWADATETNKFRILSMTGGSVTIKDLAFKGGWAALDGGAVGVVAGQLSLNNCHFFDHRASGHCGAVAHLPAAVGNAPDVGPLTVVNCLFERNEATGGQSNGGGIYSATRTSNVTIEQTRFKDNAAGNYGGGVAIAATLNNVRQVFIRGGEGHQSTFVGNVAARGGGLSLIGKDIQIDVRDTVFQANRGSLTAGAIYMSGAGGGGPVPVGSYLSALRCEFTQNVVTGIGANAVGGAIELSPGHEALFTECSFNGNAAEYGGAVYVDRSKVTVIATTFANNIAGTWGPTICYVGILNQNVWVIDPGNTLAPGDIVER